MRAGLVLTNQGTECQCQDTEKTNEESMMLESLRRVRVIQSVKIRLSSGLTGEVCPDVTITTTWPGV